MRMLATLGAGALFGTLMATAPAHAVDEGFYVGGSIGETTVEENVDGIDLDETDTSWKVFAGARFGLFGIEGGYVDLADVSDNGADAEVTGWDLFGTVNVGAGPVTVFGKAGAIAWDADVEVLGVSAGDDGTDLAYGIGASIGIMPLTAIRAEWERFDIGDLDKVDMMSLGLEVGF
ncbi:MAG: porin family protein [Gammaproteobacteria bacterium]|nr:porin family protein [Gammaproteobacteria bacterium]